MNHYIQTSDVLNMNIDLFGNGLDIKVVPDKHYIVTSKVVIM